MKNKILCLLIALVLLCLTALPVLAAQTTYIIDDMDVLTEEQENEYSNYCATIEQNHGIAVFYACINEEIRSLDVSSIIGDASDYLLIAENEDEWDVFPGGKAAIFVDSTEVDKLWDAYLSQANRDLSIYSVILACEKLISENTVMESQTQQAPIVTGNKSNDSRLFDGADLLSESEENTLRNTLDAYSQQYNVDFVIATVDTLDGYSVEAFASMYYDQGGYGCGASKDGVLLVVAMQERKWYILTNGLAHTAITDAEAESIGNSFSSYLTDENYASAFSVFADECEYEVNGEINGFPFKLGRNVLIALVVGLVISLIVTGIWRGQLKSVRQQTNATTYTKTGSMHVNLSNDFYLYSNITRTPKPQSNSSSRSGGGSSRGGAGGSF